MKENLKKILAAVLALAFVGYLLVTGISDLVNTKDRHTVNIDECAEILTIEHSINGLIPTGKDHYYVGVDYDTGAAYIMQASSSWYKKNFNADMTSNVTGGVNVTALSKWVNDFDVRNELVSRVSSLSESGLQFPLGTENRLDINYQMKAFSKLAILILGAILAVIVIWVSKSGRQANKAVGVVVLIIAVLLLVLILQVIR